MIRVLVYALPLVLAIYALVDCVQTDESAVRGLPKLGWIAVIVLIWVVGPIAWLVAGREREPRRLPGLAGPPDGEQGYRQRRPLAPDDDPEFLRRLRPSSREDEQLQQWERELRRRDEDRRRPGSDGDADSPDHPGGDTPGA